MLRIKPLESVNRADLYYEKSDAGYYRGDGGLHCEWGGKGAGYLGLDGEPDYEQFKRLIRGLDPHTGGQLTAKLVSHRLAGWDLTASVPKGVTTALERGDERIQGAIWSSLRQAMAMVEEYATTRVRMDGLQEDRRTGNLTWYAVEHAETRPVEDFSLPEGHPWRLMPDWDRHIHVVVSNLTADAVEDRWKAVKFRTIMEIRRYFDRCFDSLLADKLVNELGYEIETKRKPGGKYHTWDIKAAPGHERGWASINAKNSRRSGEVESTEQDILAEMQERHGRAPDALSAVARDKLGATSRHVKRGDLTLEDCRAYWNRRVTPDEADAVAETIRRARLGLNRAPERLADKAVDFAMRHHCEKDSAIRYEQLAATALEYGMGAATPREIEQAVGRIPGVVLRDQDGRRMVTTQELRREEIYITRFAANGRGMVAPVGVSPALERTLADDAPLNDGQWEAARGLLESTCRVDLILGPAGAGKSSLLAKFDAGMRLAGQSATYLATTSSAVKVLEDDGFAGAGTVARFLLDERMQKNARGGRVVIDEVGLLGHKDAYRLFQLAEQLDLKLILVGDAMQHGSVGRGALIRLLTEYGQVRPFRLTEILRQKHAGYRRAAELLADGRTLEGFDAIDGLGWVEEMADGEERSRAVADDYVQAMEDYAHLPENKRVAVVSPTHAEARTLTQAIRSRLREAGMLDEEEHEFTRLASADASEAERGLAETYRPGDVLQFHQNAKGFRNGQRVTVADPADVPLEHAGKFALYRAETTALAAGDRIRFTGTVRTLDGKHVLRNGMTKTVREITPGGDLRLDNGWVVSKDAGHFRHGYVDTSFSSQGKTVQRAILAMSAESLPAASQEQMYVSSSRAKERMTLYTDDKEAVREAIQRSSRKLVALDLTLPDTARAGNERRRRQGVLNRVRAAWPAPRHQRPAAAPDPIPFHQPERGSSYAR
jgi:conjugative relaxase-like TrwC/TraI family protein